MKTRKQLKKDLIKIIEDSKIIDYVVRYQDNKILIGIKEGKIKELKNR